MQIVEKNKAIRKIQKLYKGITIKAHKSDWNSSKVEILVDASSINNYIVDFDFSFDKGLQRKNTNDNLTQLAIDLRDKIMLIVLNGIRYYETGDYGTQPSEYWTLEFVKS